MMGFTNQNQSEKVNILKSARVIHNVNVCTSLNDYSFSSGSDMNLFEGIICILILLPGTDTYYYLHIKGYRS